MMEPLAYTCSQVNSSDVWIVVFYGLKTILEDAKDAQNGLAKFVVVVMADDTFLFAITYPFYMKYGSTPLTKD